MKRTKRIALLASLLMLAVLGIGMLNRNTTSAQTPAAQGNDNLKNGAVYVQTDETVNQVVAYYRQSDGTLIEAGRFPTGGQGSGGGNISQGSVILTGRDPDSRIASFANQLLLVTNTLSDEVSVFRVEKNGLVLIDRESSGGTRPISISTYQDLVYVLNERTGAISGFRLTRDGLTPIPGSTRVITGGATSRPSHMTFNPFGTVLFVSGRNTQALDAFLVDKNTGLTTGPRPNSSVGLNPFAMEFDQRGNMYVAEGHFGEKAQGSITSYKVDEDTGTIAPISPMVGNGQDFTCWSLLSEDQRYYYVSNTGNSVISSYKIKPDGTAVLFEPVAAVTGTFPGPGAEDMAFSSNSRYLYVISNNTVNTFGALNVYERHPDGTLTPIQQLGGLPPGVTGNAAR